ncbi:MAG: hypothetical protein NVSMB25_17040 [Thermoleophilaceae bacterium]
MRCCLPTGSDIKAISIHRRKAIHPPRRGNALFGIYFAPGTIVYAYTVTYTRVDTRSRVDQGSHTVVNYKVDTRYKDQTIVYREPVRHAWKAATLSQRCSAGPGCNGGYGSADPFGR